MSLSGAQKLAVLLCKFKGSDIEQNPPDYYADLFVGVLVGSTIIGSTPPWARSISTVATFLDGSR
jgi:hypothetical protein